METITNTENTKKTEENLTAQVVIIVVGNELYALLADRCINAEQNIKIDYSNLIGSNGKVMGVHLYDRSQTTVPIYNLPRLLGKERFISQLEEMKATRSDHMRFYEKLTEIVQNQINHIRGTQNSNPQLDINLLQSDHTQCEFGKKLFGFLKDFDKHAYIIDFLKRFVEPHKEFHDKVSEIKNNFNNADKLEELLCDIKDRIYPNLINLFDNFNKQIESEIKRNIYIFVRKGKINEKNGETSEIIGLRVNKALLLHQLEFKKTPINDRESAYIALDQKNILGYNQGGEPAIIQLILDIEQLLQN